MSRFFPTADLGKRILGKATPKPSKNPVPPKPEKPRKWTVKNRAKPGEGFSWRLVSYKDVHPGTKSEVLLKVFIEMQSKDPERIFHYAEIQQEMIRRGYLDYDRPEGHRTVVNLLRRIKEVERHEKGRFRFVNPVQP